jgi:predicted transposase YbfD/YdcC
MKEESVLSIQEAFGDLKDPRSRTSLHNLQEMLLIALCAILCGAETWVAIQIWAQEKLGWLRRFVPLENGIPSHDTFGRVFAALDARCFEACFIRWMSGLVPTLTDEIVAIDGKTVRRSHGRGQRPIHLVSAYGAGFGAVLGQVRTSEKSNEITAIPELLEALEVKGAIVTIDAMGCQRDIAQRLVQAGADYVLAVKENQPTLHRRISNVFEAIERIPKAYQGENDSAEFCEVEKNHGRIETRRCVVSDQLTRWHDFEPLWPGARSIVMIESTREIGPNVSTERRYYVSSLLPDPVRIARAVRSHWAIESMHWTLDVAFNEDQCRARVENAAQNFAILRRMTLNLLRQDRNSKVGIKIRRMKACSSERYLAQLLDWQERSSTEPSDQASCLNY